MTWLILWEISFRQKLPSKISQEVNNLKTVLPETGQEATAEWIDLEVVAKPCFPTTDILAFQRQVFSAMVCLSYRSLRGTCSRGGVIKVTQVEKHTISSRSQCHSQVGAHVLWSHGEIVWINRLQLCLGIEYWLLKVSHSSLLSSKLFMFSLWEASWKE